MDGFKESFRFKFYSAVVQSFLKTLRKFAWKRPSWRQFCSKISVLLNERSQRLFMFDSKHCLNADIVWCKNPRVTKICQTVVVFLIKCR